MTSFVLVHGAFVDGWYWGETARVLEKEGHAVQVANLPSCGTDPAALGGLADDVEEVRRLVAAAAAPVVLVGHSYGGMVITELADDTRVALSVYVSAVMPDRGQSALDALGGTPDWVVPTEDGAAAHVTDDRERAALALCADLDPQRVAEWYAHLMYVGLAAVTTPSTAPGRTHPVAVVVLENDAVFPLEAQEAMAARADRVERLATSHNPQLADPDGLAAALARLAA